MVYRGAGARKRAPSLKDLCLELPQANRHADPDGNDIHRLVL